MKKDSGKRIAFGKAGRVVLSAMLASAMMVPAAALADPGDVTPDSTIEVTGLNNGDTAKYYKVLSMTANGVITLCDPSTGKTFSYVNDDDETVTITKDMLLDGITAQEAGAIVGGFVSTDGTDMGTASGGKVTATVDPGTYLVIVTPADNETVYAPIIVSADYDANSPNTIDASDEDSKLPNPGSVVAKKQDVGITKSATSSTSKTGDGDDTTADNDNSPQSVANGDTVSFKVESATPSFTLAQQDLKFTISDTVGAGLSIKTNTVKVKIGTSAEQAVAADGYYYANASDGASASSYDFKVSALDASTWKIEFSESYLTTVVAGTSVVVTYDAEVTAAGDANVTQLTNDAQVDFTHSPDGSTESRTDDTKHYTYSLDTSIAGSTATGHEGNSSELVKIGTDENGDPILEKTNEKNWVVDEQTYHSPLEGAVFTLTGLANGNVYTATTDADGLMAFQGLDAGEYTLQETKAPAGYQLDETVYNIKIEPTFKADGTLESYKVLIKGPQDADYVSLKEYNIEYDGETGEIASAEPTAGTAANHQFFENKKNPPLPTTGGVGTMALTAGGLILVIGGAYVLLRSRRRQQQ